MPSAKVTSKGQITIPMEVRKSLGISAGDEIVFFNLGGGRFLVRPRTASIRDLKGIGSTLDYIPTLDQLEEGIGGAIEEEFLESVRRDVVDPSSSDRSKHEAA